MYFVIYDVIIIKSINIVKFIIVDIGVNGKYFIKYILFICRKVYIIFICIGILSSNGVIFKNKFFKISIFFMFFGDNLIECNIVNFCCLFLIFFDIVVSIFDNLIIVNKFVIKFIIKFMVFILLVFCFLFFKIFLIL